MDEKGVFVNATLHQGRDRIWQLLAREDSDLNDLEKNEIETFNANWDEAKKVWEKKKK